MADPVIEQPVASGMTDDEERKRLIGRGPDAVAPLITHAKGAPLPLQSSMPNIGEIPLARGLNLSSANAPTPTLAPAPNIGEVPLHAVGPQHTPAGAGAVPADTKPVGPQATTPTAAPAASASGTPASTNPFAGLMAHAENIHNPVLRVLAKLGAGIASAPAAAAEYAVGPLKREEEGREAKTAAETEHLKAETKKLGQPAVSTPEQQASQAKLTAQTRLGEIETAMQNPNLPGDQKTALANEQQKIYASQPELVPPTRIDKPIGEPGVAQRTTQAASAGARLQEGAVAPVPPTFTKEDTGTTAGDKMKDYERAVNDANLEYAKEQASARTESQKEASDRRAEERRDRGVPGYSVDDNGMTIITDKYHAQLRGTPFEQATSGDFSRDRNATRQLNDVQMNVSRYTVAANKYDQAQASGKISQWQATKDQQNLHTLLDKAGIGDINFAVSEGGHLDLGAITKFGEDLSRQSRSQAYQDLSKEGKALFDGYQRTMAAVPAYQKALTNIGRTNKEMLDLELNTVAPPTFTAKDIQGRQAQFQENIDRAAAGFPKFPGMPKIDETRAEEEHPKAKAEAAKVHDSMEDFSIQREVGGQTYYSDDGKNFFDSKGKVVK